MKEYTAGGGPYPGTTAGMMTATGCALAVKLVVSSARTSTPVARRSWRCLHILEPNSGTLACEMLSRCYLSAAALVIGSLMLERRYKYSNSAMLACACSGVARCADMTDDGLS